MFISQFLNLRVILRVRAMPVVDALIVPLMHV